MLLIVFSIVFFLFNNLNWNLVFFSGFFKRIFLVKNEAVIGWYEILWFIIVFSVIKFLLKFLGVIEILFCESW